MNAIGKKGEEIVAQYLKKEGYVILERNWRLPIGEIDIIAISEECLVFVEVKTLVNTTLESLDLLIGKHKQLKIAKVAKHFLKNNRQYHMLMMRFDVIVLKSDPFMVLKPNILHIKNAFGDCND